LRTTSSRAYSRFSQAIRPSPRSSETTPAGLRPARSDCNSVAPLDGRDRVELDARGALGRRCPRLQRRRGRDTQPWAVTTSRRSAWTEIVRMLGPYGADGVPARVASSKARALPAETTLPFCS
jgi:hypothetical protein